MSDRDFEEDFEDEQQEEAVKDKMPPLETSMSDTGFEGLLEDEQEPEEIEDKLAPFKDRLAELEDVVASEQQLARLEPDTFSLKDKPVLLEYQLTELYARLLLMEYQLVFLGYEQPMLDHEDCECEDEMAILCSVTRRRELRKPSKIRKAWKFLKHIATVFGLLSPIWYLTMFSSRPPFILRARIRERDYDIWSMGYRWRTGEEWQRRRKAWNEAKKAAEARPGDSIRQASLRSLHRSSMREDLREKDGPNLVKAEAQEKELLSRLRAMSSWDRFKIESKVKFDLLWQDEGVRLARWFLGRAAAEKTELKAPQQSNILGFCKIDQSGSALKKTQWTGGRRTPFRRASKPPTSTDGRCMMSTAAKATCLSMHSHRIESHGFDHRAIANIKLPATNRKIVSILGLSVTAMETFSGAVRSRIGNLLNFCKAPQTHRRRHFD